MCSWHDIAWATHQPVLHHMCCKDNAKILEYGCGIFSDRLLSWLQPQYNLNIIAYESDKEWIDKVKDEIKPPYTIYPVSSWDEHFKIWDALFPTFPMGKEKWDVVFVDQAPWEARHETIKRYHDKCEYLILHDCDYYPHEKIFEYSDYFKYWKLFVPPGPSSSWPWKTGPPTLLASNFNKVEDIEISYTKAIHERNSKW